MAKLIVCYLLLSFMVSAEPWLPLSYAEQPTRGFNRLIAESAAKQEAWVTDSQQVALHYLGSPDQIEIVAERSDPNSVEVTLRQPLNRAGVESTLFLLQLDRNAQGIWQLTNARMAWRCQDQGHFDTRRCQASY